MCRARTFALVKDSREFKCGAPQDLVTGAHCNLAMIHRAADFNRSLDFRMDLLFITSAWRLAVGCGRHWARLQTARAALQGGMGWTIGKTNCG